MRYLATALEPRRAAMPPRMPEATGPRYENPLPFDPRAREKAMERISAKIKVLVAEGKPQKQAAAAATDMEKRGRLGEEGQYFPAAVDEYRRRKRMELQGRRLTGGYRSVG